MYYETESSVRVPIGQKERCAWVHYGTERWHQWTMRQKGCGYTTGQKEGCGYTMGQKGCRTEGRVGYTLGQKDGTNPLWDKKDVGRLWDRKDVGQKERCAWVHFGTERWLQCTMGQKG